MSKKASNLVDFIHKSFSISPNGYDAKDFAALLTLASTYNSYVETVNDKDLPNADTLHLKIKKNADVLSLLENFLNITKKYLPMLNGKRAVVIADITYDPFFGDESAQTWVHGYKPVKGCIGCYKFFAMHIIVDNKRYFVYAILLDIIDNQAELLEEALDYIKGYGIKIKHSLLDRGFADSKILELFRKRKMKYLVLYPKHRNIKKIVREMKRSFINRKFYVKGVETRLVIGKTEKITWVFVTNMQYMDLVKYIRLYRKRWNIETGFRMQDEAQIKTKSKRIEIRYFYFLIALLLYNCWKVLKEKISLRRFLIEMQRGVEICKHTTKPT